MKILVIEDEAAIRRLLRSALERVGYSVIEAETARAGLASLDVDKPDAVLLDLGLADRDGLEIIPQISALGIALIVVTARDDVTLKITALDLGADDYVTKPFDTEELLARLRASQRHMKGALTDRAPIRIGEIEIDLLQRRISRNGEDVHLTPREYDLFAALAAHPGRVQTHTALLTKVWGIAHVHDLEYLRVTMRSLRRKLEEDVSSPRLLVNEPGVGYRLMTE